MTQRPPLPEGLNDQLASATAGGIGSGRGKPRRAVLLDGAGHGTMALARSLKDAGFEVWFVTHETNLACFSRAMKGVVHWPGATGDDAIGLLEALTDAQGLGGSLLIPAGDAEVFLVAHEHARLCSRFEVLTTDWSQLKWACNKALAYERAVQLGLDVPRVHETESLRDPARLQYPLVLKPAIRLAPNPFTVAKAWRVDHWSAFDERYSAACSLVGAGNVVVQELVPGPGENQLSYAGLWNKGEPVVSFTACRLRQYPVEFGRSSTYVRTERVHDVTVAAESFLRSIRHHGLVEVEFKRDARTGVLKLLDVNPRPWTWLSLAVAAGVDFGKAIADLVAGRQVTAMAARDGVAWLSLARDLAAVAQGRAGWQSLRGYPADCVRARAYSAFALSDPLPGLMELPLTGMRMLERLW